MTNPRFEPVGSRIPFREMEEQLRADWRDGDIFRRSVEERPADKIYSFYEGPPTANGAPGVHHVLARVFKDLFPRYLTMRGYRVPRKAGWDTHGLPVELEVERELGLQSKAEIEDYGIAAFNRRCRESVMRYVEQWEDLTERIAFWVDMSDPYVTHAPEYVETCWWIFKTLWDRGLIYEAQRVTPHCPRCETSLSSHELALGYQENTPDPSVFVRFRADPDTLPEALRGFNGDTFLLAWTTTPWTLPGNTGLAVAADATYSAVDVRPGERLVMAEACRDAVFDGIANLAPEPQVTLPGRDLVGVTYTPLYDLQAWGVPAQRFLGNRLEAWPDAETPRPVPRVVAADFVTMEDGAGIVHIAPAFGEEDYALGREAGLLFVQPVDLEGRMTGEASPFAGQFVKDADTEILTDLQDRGLLLKQQTIRHTYPFCWRCETPLLYYAKPSWYIATTKICELLTRTNREDMQWHPEHIRDGRYGDWLANNVDWAVSRERYWGTPLPFWRCVDCRHTEALGSFDELRARARGGAPNLRDPHRPYVDAIEIDCPQCSAAMRRVPEVADAWFDSGAMPYAQWHYPFENVDTFQELFPADFICEAVDQTRGWFYSLHAVAALLYTAEEVPEPVSYRHVISLGHILDEAGEKMSKSRGNVVDPWSVLDAHGADALRWYLYSAGPPGNPRRFSSNLVGEAQRRFLLTLWNTYSFFVTYANIDGFDPASEAPQTRPELDRWIRSALQRLITTVTDALDAYDPTTAARALEQFVESLSNWYVRRSRRRFWKSEDDQDKAAAYHTLYDCLLTLSQLLAPFTPYMADAIYRNLASQGGGGAQDSVHLASWPKPDPALMDEELEAAMDLVQRVASLGRASRTKAGVKVRQPLPEVVVGLSAPEEEARLRRYESMLLDELNVKRLTVAGTATDLVAYTIKPNLPVLGPRLGKDVVRLRAALAALEPERAAQVAAAVAGGDPVEIDGVALSAADLLVEMRERAGAGGTQDAPYTVAVTTEISPELRREGLAREIVHRVQNLRREAGFEIADRIALSISGDAPQALAAVRAFAGYIQAETLAPRLELDDGSTNADAATAPSSDGVSRRQDEIDGEVITLTVRRI